MHSPHPVAHLLTRLLALLPLALLVACTRQHEAHLLIHNPQPQPDSLYIVYPERTDGDTSRILVPPSSAPADVPIAIEGPELVLIGRPGTAEPSVLLLSPNDQIQVEMLSQGLGIAGSQPTGRILALRAYIKSFQHEVGQLSATYPTVNERGAYDSIRGVRIEQHDSLLASARAYLTDFIRAEPYSKASLVALLAEYDTGRPFLPIGQYHELFAHVTGNLAPLYPRSHLVRRIMRSLDSLQVGLSLHTSTAALRTGDTIPPLPHPIDSLRQPYASGPLLIVVKMPGSSAYALQTYAQRDPARQAQLQAIVCHVAQGIEPEAYLYAPGLHDSTRRQLPARTAQELVSQLGINTLPVAMLIDRHGVIRSTSPTPDEVSELCAPPHFFRRATVPTTPQ